MLFYLKNRFVTIAICLLLFLFVIACTGDPAPNPDGWCHAPSPCQVQP